MVVTVVTVAACGGDSGDFNVMSTAQGHMRTRVMIVLVSGCGDSGFVVITVMGGSDGGVYLQWCNCCCNPRRLLMSHKQSPNKGSESALDTRHANTTETTLLWKWRLPRKCPLVLHCPIKTSVLSTVCVFVSQRRESPAGFVYM